MSQQGKTIAIIGAGPVGLAAGAHAIERNLTPVLLEAGPQVAHAVRQWHHVRMFSPWEFNVDKAARRLLEAAGWKAPDPGAYPTGAEFIRQYLEPLAMRTNLRAHLRTQSRVTAISRVGFDKVKTKGRSAAPFEIRYEGSKGPETLRADAVIDTSGTWFTPNPAGVNGLPAMGEAALAHRISYGMPDVLGTKRARYAGKKVAVLGAGHSALGTLIDLVKLAEAEPATQVVWLLRSNNPEKSFGGGSADALEARGELGSTFARLVRESRLLVEASFGVTEISEREGRLRIGTGSSSCDRHVSVDELVVATGFRPDLTFASELRLSLDPALDCPAALAPLIDPNEHSCGTVRPHGARELAHPEPGFAIAGMKSYGRAPTFLALTGYEQVRSIVAEIAGDTAAAARVELVLPETGVCSISSSLKTTTGCCSAPAPSAPSSKCSGSSETSAATSCGAGRAATVTS